MKGGLYKFSSNRSKFSLVHFVKIKEAKTKKNIFLGILLTLDQVLKPFFFTYLIIEYYRRNDLLSATNFYFKMHRINYQSPQKI